MVTSLLIGNGKGTDPGIRVRSDSGIFYSAFVAQLVEQGFCKAQVVSSILSEGIIAQ